MEEVWADVRGYEGYYKISNYGIVKSLDRKIYNPVKDIYFTKKGQTIAIQHNKRNNIYMVMLNKEGKRKAYSLHRLVAEHFVENDDRVNKTTVNHIDGDRNNNKSSNLEWCSYSANLQHAYDKLNRPVNKGCVRKRACRSFNKNTETENTYKSVAEASRKTGLSETQIRMLIANECVNNTYTFEYIYN